MDNCYFCSKKSTERVTIISDRMSLTFDVCQNHLIFPEIQAPEGKAALFLKKIIPEGDDKIYYYFEDAEDDEEE